MYGYIFALLIAILLVRLVHKEMEMRNDLLCGFTFAALLLASYPILSPLHLSTLTPLMVVISYFALFQIPEQANPPVQSFVAYLLLGTTSLLYPKILWLIPVFLIAQILFQAMNIKVILASALGVIVPWIWKWILETCGLTLENIANVAASLHAENSSLVSRPSSLVSVSALLLLFLWCLWNFRKRTYFNKSRTRLLYQVIILLQIASFVMLVFDSEGFSEWYMLLLVNTSLLVSRVIDRII